MKTDNAETVLARVLIHTMDFNLLRAQKTVIIDMQSKFETSSPEWSTLEGMINLLDAIQDTAVDCFGRKKKDVFNFVDGNDEPQVSLEACRKIVLCEEEPAEATLLIPVGTEVICNGERDVIIAHVEPGTDNHELGFRYILQNEGTQSDTNVDEIEGQDRKTYTDDQDRDTYIAGEEYDNWK